MILEVLKTKIPVFLLVFSVLLSIKPLGGQADVFDYFVVSGMDVSDGSAADFDSDTLIKLGANDDSRIQSDGSWPTGGFFDDGRFIEFVFEPRIQSDALIEKTVITFEWRRSGTLNGAKLEIWDGQNFITKTLQLPQISNSDFSEQLDLTSDINTPAKLNSLKIKFLAYRNTAVNTKTSHDFVKLSILGSGITSQPKQTSTPTPSPTPSPTPILPPTSTPAPTIITSPAPSLFSTFSPSPVIPSSTPPKPSPSQSLPGTTLAKKVLPVPDFAAPTVSLSEIPRQQLSQQSPALDSQEALIAKTIDEIENQSELADTDWTESKYLFLLITGVITLIIYFRLRGKKTNSRP